MFTVRRIRSWLLIVGIATVLAACGGDKEPTPAPTATSGPPAAPEVSGNAEEGKKLFATTCAACHGPSGEGVSGLGKDMTSSEFIAERSDAELLEFVKQGRGPTDPLNTTGVLMPPKGGNPALSDEQLMDIIAYVRSIHKE